MYVPNHTNQETRINGFDNPYSATKSFIKNNGAFYHFLFVVLLLERIMLSYDLETAQEYIHYSDELALILLFPFFFSGLRIFVSSNIWGRRFILFSILYLLFGTLSRIFLANDFTNIISFFYDIIIILKFPYIVIALSGMNISRKSIGKTSYYYKLIITVLALSVFAQYFLPDLYSWIFPGTLETYAYYLDRNIFRASGFFNHPAIFGGFTSLLVIYYSQYYSAERKPEYLFYGAVALLLLISSMQRQEIVAVIIVISAFALKQSGSMNAKMIMGIKIAFFLCLFLFMLLYFFPDFQQYLLVQYELLKIEEGLYSSHPRGRMYFTSFDIANNYFPLGVGFGNFGGFAASLFDSDIYHQYSFESAYWFKRREFLNDTYWPQVIAESGWLGMLFHLLSIFSLILFANGRINHKASTPLQIVQLKIFVLSIVFLLITSLSTPIFKITLLLFMAFLGSARILDSEVDNNESGNGV